MTTPSGVTLNASEWPFAGDSTCVLLHGFGHDGRTWDPLSSNLGDSYRVLALDFRGHGDSAWDARRNYCHNALLEDLDTLVSSLKLPRFHLVGHSMGARVAMLYAARHPGAVSSLTIVDTGPEVGAKGVRRMREVAASQPQYFPNPESYFQWLRTRHPLASRERLLHMAQHGLKPANGQWQPKTDPEFARILWRQDNPHTDDDTLIVPLTRELWEALDQLRCPTLVMRGQLSSILKPHTAQAMVEDHLIDGTLVTVTKAGHAVMLDNPAECTSAIRRFINQARSAERLAADHLASRHALRAFR